MATQVENPPVQDIKVASEQVQTEEPKPVVETAPEEKKVEASGEEKPKVTGGFQKRIDKLTRQLKEAQEQLEVARSIAPKATVAPQSSAPADDPEPKEEDFDNYKDFVKATSRWEARQIIREEEQAALQEELKAEGQEKFQAYTQKLEEARSRYEDWDEVQESAENLLLTPSAQVCIIEADNGPEILYWLAKNPEAAKKLEDMSDARVAVEIGRISAKLDPGTEKEEKKPEKIESKAPAPIKPLGGTARGETKLAEMSMDDFINQRNKEERERRRILG